MSDITPETKTVSASSATTSESNSNNATSLSISHASKKRWIGLDVQPDQDSLEHARKLFSQLQAAKNFQVKSIPGQGGQDPYHITLLFGFDPAHYDRLYAMVTEAKVTADDIQWKEVYLVEPAHTPGEAYICLDLASEKLTALKSALLEAAKQDSAAKEHSTKTPLHVTLMTLKK